MDSIGTLSAINALSKSDQTNRQIVKPYPPELDIVNKIVYTKQTPCKCLVNAKRT